MIKRNTEIKTNQCAMSYIIQFGFFFMLIVIRSVNIFSIPLFIEIHRKVFHSNPTVTKHRFLTLRSFDHIAIHYYSCGTSQFFLSKVKTINNPINYIRRIDLRIDVIVRMWERVIILITQTMNINATLRKQSHPVAPLLNPWSGIVYFVHLIYFEH